MFGDIFLFWFPFIVVGYLQSALAQPLVIDFQSLLKRDDIELKKLKAAVKNLGFFHVINHGIQKELQDDVFSQMKQFFDSEIKFTLSRTENNSRGFAATEFTKQRVDAKQVFDIGHKPYPDLDDDSPLNVVLDGYNQWPVGDNWLKFRSVVEYYYFQCSSVSASLVVSILESFKGHLSDSVLEQFSPHTSFLRLNYYPLCNRTTDISEVIMMSDGNIAVNSTANEKCDHGQLGVHRHTDAGLLTLLLQDEQHSALQVYSGSKEEFGDGEWTPVNPVAGALTVNIGDMLQVLSNGYFKAPEHRVLASEGYSPRYSAAFFYNPNYDAIIKPVLPNNDPAGPEINDPESTLQRTAVYEPIQWGAFRQERFLGDLHNRGREIQIEDFLVSLPP